MISTIKNIYDSVEETYLEIENIILDHAEDAYLLSKDYIENTSEEITLFLSNYFNNTQINKLDDPVLQQLNKLTISLSTLDLDSNEEWDSKLIFVATSIGHLNEKIVILLCNYYDTSLYGKNTQASKINTLKSELSKTIINDLHFINTFRNSILHHNDYGYDLSILDKVNKNKLLCEAKAAIAKFEYIYQHVKNLKRQSKRDVD
jgi:hypothetical protein